MMRRLIPALLAIVAFHGSAATAGEVSVEIQAYPTGVVASVGGKLDAGRPGRFWTLRVGYNDADRDDAGKRDDEEGGGPGVSFGWRTMLRDPARGWFAGARADLWALEIDWSDQPGTPGETNGTTDVWVLQPTGELGYRLPFGRAGRWVFEPSVSLGVEWNLRTEGRNVGEGPILLIGASLSRAR